MGCTNPGGGCCRGFLSNRFNGFLRVNPMRLRLLMVAAVLAAQTVCLVGCGAGSKAEPTMSTRQGRMPPMIGNDGKEMKDKK
jgi:hypothetical protein